MKVLEKGKLIPRGLLRKFETPMRIDRDEPAFQDLVRDIGERGIEEDLIVRVHPREEGCYELIDGHRRYEATGVLEWGNEGLLPCELREMTDEEAYSLALRLNILRSPPSPKSIGNWIQMMRMKFALSQKEVGLRIGKSQSWVSRHEKFILDATIPKGSTERQARALRGAPEAVRRAALEKSEETGRLPTAREIQEQTEKRIKAVLQRLDYSHHDEEYAAYIFEAEGGFTPEEAKDLASKWDRRELGREEKKEKKSKTVNRRDNAVQVYEELIKWYPGSIIDAVTTKIKSTNFETLKKHCRRYVSELMDRAPDELKQTVLDRFQL